MLYRIVLILFSIALALAIGCNSASKLTGGAKTTVQITNKITTLAAGARYDFNVDIEHDQGAGFTVSLSGAGTVANTGPTATYVAPAAPPAPNSVTVTVTAANGSGVSDSDTFSIVAAAGPVVTISPGSFNARAGGAAVTLNVSVTMDDPSDVLTIGVSGSPACGGACGSFGPLNGAPGSGAYTIDYVPPATITESTQQTVEALSNLANATGGTSFVYINP